MCRTRVFPKSLVVAWYALARSSFALTHAAAAYCIARHAWHRFAALSALLPLIAAQHLRQQACKRRALPPMTLASLLWFAMVWLKYEVTPEPLRYFWWVVWSKVRVAAHAVHRRLVVQGEYMHHRSEPHGMSYLCHSGTHTSTDDRASQRKMGGARACNMKHWRPRA